MDAEERILQRHQYKPSSELYHYASYEKTRQIINDDVLEVGTSNLLSLSANPRLKNIFPEKRRRECKLVLDFKKLKEDYSKCLFPVYYYTDKEWDTQEPPEWLKEYYNSKEITRCDQDIDRWNTAPAIYLSKDIFSHESEWKSACDIEPLNKYLIRVEGCDIG